MHLANLRKTDLRIAKLIDAKLYYANLTRAQLYGADLRNAKLYNANLRNADLSNAFFKNADLRNADLRNADLNSVFLLRTDLREMENLNLSQLQYPLICNSKLPQNIKIDRNRDCDRIPAALHERYPNAFLTLKKAEKYVQELRQKKWD